MALIKRVAIAALMSLLSEGCIAAEAPAERTGGAQAAQPEQTAHAAPTQAGSGLNGR